MRFAGTWTQINSKLYFPYIECASCTTGPIHAGPATGSSEREAPPAQDDPWTELGNLLACAEGHRQKGQRPYYFSRVLELFYVQRKLTETKTLRQENNVLFWCLIIMLLQLQILTSFTDSWTPSGWLFSRTSMSTEHKEASGLLSWTKRWKCLQMYIFYKLPKRLCVV